MQKNYDHTTEDSLYADWKQSGKMRADNQSKKKAFTIPLPPPNVTGQLHLGHAAMLAIEDIMIRYKKMTDHEVLWIPGTDHAAIATENVVLKHLGAKSREEYSREEFLGHCREFAQEKHDTITNQMEKMGAWLDWSREAYTFDETRNHAVSTIFKMLYEDELIERGHRMINWSVGAQSVLADDELEWEEGTAPFYYIRCGEFVIGTVRSETKCANSPLLLHPDTKYVKIKSPKNKFIISEFLFNNPERFNEIFNLTGEVHGDFEIIETYCGSDLEGQEFEYDTYAGMRKFYVLCDAKVIDPEKGSGSMTISPCHSQDDYDLAKRLKLDKYFIEKINFRGKMTAIAGKCEGFEVAKARNVSSKIMKEKGLLVGVEKNYKNRVPMCYRSGCVVEPMISPQWFITVEKEFTDKFTGEKTTLKKQMQEAVRGGHVKIIPEKFEKEYFRWIDSLRDWCISRQIWWGHRVPVWYDKDNNIVATGIQDEKDIKPTWRQDEDTLDTWFSSALWPFSTTGWLDEKSKDFDKFYPNDVLETGWDIIFFWVARMIMFGKYATGKYPFHTVYLHGMVTDEYGKKMSKSKGNGIDPLDMIKDFGADPIRLALVIGSTPGQNIPIGANKIKGYRNFVNKLWNAGRFVEMQTESVEAKNHSPLAPKSLAEKWILTRFAITAKMVSKDLENYQISGAGDKIYHFVWDEFCNWFIEASKLNPNPEFLAGLYAEILKLTHPLCPFVTEQIWKDLYGAEEDLLVEQNFPDSNFKDEGVISEFEKIQKLVNEIRSLRAENKLNPKEKLQISATASSSSLLQEKEGVKIIEVLAGVKFEVFEDTLAQKIIVDDIEILVKIPVDEARKEREIEAVKKEILALEGRLSNKKYVDNAPEALVNETKASLESAKNKLAKMS